MSLTLRMIAKKIHERGQHQGWKLGSKTADKLNLEAWCGALAALETINGPDLGHIAEYVAMVISVRGYSATIHLAVKED